MFKKIFHFILSVRREFLSYALIGGSGTILDLSSLFALKQSFGLHPVTAVIVNQALMVCYIFFLNKLITFRANGVTRRQFMRFISLTAYNYCFAVFWMWFLYNNFHIHYLLVRVSGIGLAVSWNFLLYKYWVYRVDNSPGDPLTN